MIADVTAAVASKAHPATASSLVEISCAGQPLHIETLWVGGPGSNAAPLVFLHEGLGSVAMWRDFPSTLCAALGRRGLVYSRPGYGQSTPRAAGDAWGADFMHHQAHAVLPALLKALQVHEPVVLVGHSDGGSIALLYAAQYPAAVERLVVMAPHITVENEALQSIRQARKQYLEGGLRAKLSRYHADVDSAFWGWNDVWLSPGFVRWEITSNLKYIRARVLAVQGFGDEYGTMAQIDGIAQALPGTQLLKLQNCGHSPHRNQPQVLTDAIAAFLS